MSGKMTESGTNLARFFSWARERAFLELEKRLAADPSLDPNWTFSDIMQRLLVEYQAKEAKDPAQNEAQ